MSSCADEQYWTPTDKFILNTVEKHGSLAMLNPRIQSPYDLLTWDEMKFDNVMKYKFTRDIKAFYLKFLSKETIMDHEDFFEDNRVVLNPKVDGEILMSHPPVLGHWLEESGFIKDKHRNYDHEFNLKEYRSLFDINDAKMPTTRKYLHPSFEGMSIDRIKKFRKLGPDPCMFTDRATDIMFIAEQIKFNEYSGKYDQYMFLTADKFLNDSLIDETDKYEDLGMDEIYIRTVNKNGTAEPVLELYNDMSYEKEKDTNVGFFKTDIRIAYHMNFDLTSQFVIDYELHPDKIGIDLSKGPGAGIMHSQLTSTMDYGIHIDEENLTKFRRHGDMTKDIISAGRLLHHPRIDKSVTQKLRIQEGKLEEIQDSINKNFKSSSGNMWTNYTILKDDDVEHITRKDSCYSSYFDYYHYEKKISEIMTKDKSNYFWFMYGSLPSNNIYYEDLNRGLQLRSVFNDNDETTRWSIEDRNQIFNSLDESVGGFKPKIMLESEKDEFIRVSKQCIKFLGLIYSMGAKDNECDTTIKTYYICNSSKIVKSSLNKYDVLDSVNRRITSSKYTKPDEKKTLAITATAAKLSDPIESDKKRGTDITLKIRSDGEFAKITRDEFEFLKTKDLLSDKAKSLYTTLHPGFSRETPEYKEFIMDIEKNIAMIYNYISRPTKDLSTIPIPDEVKRIDPKEKSLVKSTFNTKDNETTKISPDIVDRLRDISRIVLDENTQMVSKNMLLYLKSWRLIEHNDPKDLPYIKINDKNYMNDTNNDLYKKIQEELRSKNIETNDPFMNIEETKVYGYDNQSGGQSSGGGGQDGGGRRENETNAQRKEREKKEREKKEREKKEREARANTTGAAPATARSGNGNRRRGGGRT